MFCIDLPGRTPLGFFGIRDLAIDLNAEIQAFERKRRDEVREYNYRRRGHGI